MKLKRLDTNKKAKGGMVQRRGLNLRKGAKISEKGSKSKKRGRNLRKGVIIFEKESQSQKGGQNLRKGVKISKKGSKSEEKGGQNLVHRVIAVSPPLLQSLPHHFVS